MAEEQIQYLPLDRITAVKQPREKFDEEALAGLAQSLNEVGQQQPLRLRRDGDKFVIVDGERRFRAAKKAGFTTVAVVIEERELCAAEIIHRQLVANCQRQDLGPMEKARSIDQLMKETGWTATQAALKLGFSNATLTRLLSLLQLPVPLQQRVEAGHLPPSAGYELARVVEPTQQAALAEQMENGEMTRDGLSGALKQRKKQTETSQSKELSRVTAALGAGRSVTVAGANLTLETFIQSLEELIAKARKVRPQGVELATFIRMMKDQAKV